MRWCADNDIGTDGAVAIAEAPVLTQRLSRLTPKPIPYTLNRDLNMIGVWGVLVAPSAASHPIPDNGTYVSLVWGGEMN